MMTETDKFTVFMQNYQQMVYATAYRLLANDAEAQDVAQEVFLRAHRHFHEVGLSPTAGGWLKKVTTNLCLNHLSRYRARWTFFSDLFSRDSEDRNFIEEIPSPEQTDKALVEADRKEMVQRALEKLSPAQRVPLVLYHFENKRYEEIAELLGITLGKVKTDIFRARESLRKMLNLSLDEDGETRVFTPPFPPAPRAKVPARIRTKRILSAAL
jgi:RNA polymerase sigma-70 factor, ECF subfamily